MLKGIVYVSTTKVYISNHAMKEYCIKFQKNNMDHGITGILLFASGVVMQYIEGNNKKIDALYSNIVSDERHHNFIKLFDEDINNKIFKDWGMKFKIINIEEMLDIKADISKNKICVLEILRSFIRVNNL
jgi:hypothetical protein